MTGIIVLYHLYSNTVEYTQAPKYVVHVSIRICSYISQLVVFSLEDGMDMCKHTWASIIDSRLHKLKSVCIHNYTTTQHVCITFIVVELLMVDDTIVMSKQLVAQFTFMSRKSFAVEYWLSLGIPRGCNTETLCCCDIHTTCNV